MDSPPKLLLERLYYDEGLTQTEIADRLGEEVHQKNVSEWMQECGIAPGKRTDLAAEAVRVNYATYTQHAAGYEQWKVRCGSEMKGVLVHRLAAVAWFGFDSVAGNDVHHETNIPWDNREETSASTHPKNTGQNTPRRPRGTTAAGLRSGADLVDRQRRSKRRRL